MVIVTLILTFYLEGRPPTYKPKNKSIALFGYLKKEKIEQAEIKAKNVPERKTTNFPPISYLNSPIYVWQRLPDILGFDGICRASAKASWFSFLELGTLNISLQPFLTKRQRKWERKLQLLALYQPLPSTPHQEREDLESQEALTESIHTQEHT